MVWNLWPRRKGKSPSFKSKQNVIHVFNNMLFVDVWGWCHLFIEFKSWWWAGIAKIKTSFLNKTKAKSTAGKPAAWRRRHRGPGAIHHSEGATWHCFIAMGWPFKLFNPIAMYFMLNLHQQCLSDHEFNATMPNPRPKGELAVTHKGRGVKLVLAPPHSPITLIYRNGCHQLKLAETEVSQEQLASFSIERFWFLFSFIYGCSTCIICWNYLPDHMPVSCPHDQDDFNSPQFMTRTFHCSPPQAHSQDEWHLWQVWWCPAVVWEAGYLDLGVLVGLEDLGYIIRK